MNSPRQPVDFEQQGTNPPEITGLVALAPRQPSRHTSTEDISLTPDSFEASRGVYFCNRLFFELLLRYIVGNLGNIVSYFCGNAFDVGGNDVFRAFLEDRDTSESFRDQ